MQNKLCYKILVILQLGFTHFLIYSSYTYSTTKAWCTNYFTESRNRVLAGVDLYEITLRELYSLTISVVLCAE